MRRHHFIHFFVRELLNKVSDRIDNSLRLAATHNCTSLPCYRHCFNFMICLALVTVCSLMVLPFVHCAVFSVTALFDSSTVAHRSVHHLFLSLLHGEFDVVLIGSWAVACRTCCWWSSRCSTTVTYCLWSPCTCPSP